VKTLLKSILVCVVLMMAAALASAQTFTKINPPPCDFSNQFYGDNGLDINQLVLRFGDNGGTTRLTGPPATGTQHNYVADTTDCSATDPTRRDFRILATTGGNSDDGNSPFSCFDGATTPGQPGPGQFGPFAVFPQCANQPGANPAGQVPETLEFISILAFVDKQSAFLTTYSRTVGAITNGGLDGVQSNAGEVISIVNSANPRGIRMEDIIGNFEAYAAVKQVLPNGQFALNPCAVDMQSPLAPATPCFSVADTLDSHGNVIDSDVSTPHLRQDWRFATNRNAIDGSDNNCINNTDQNCKHKAFSDSPFGYFCDDLLGAWILTYFWYTVNPLTEPSTTTCGKVFANIAAKNGKNLDGTPVILTAHELNDELEANGCGAEGQEAVDGTDKGAVWLICPAIPDPRNGAIASDAFLDVATHNSLLDPFVSNNFACLQTTGKFCFEHSVE